MSVLKQKPPIANNDFEEPFMKSYRWVMLAIIWLAYGVFGLSVRSMAPLVTPMLRDLSMSFGQMGVILGSWQLVYIPVSILAGIAMDKWGIRRTIFVGVVIMALSEGLRYFATGFGSLLPIVALFGIGGPLISIGAPKTIAVWFRGKNRATAVGLYTTAPWIGGFFATAATNSLIMPLTGYSWRLTFVSYGLLALAVAVIWFILARDTGRTDDSITTGLKDVFLRLIKVRNVIIVLLAGLLILLMEHGFSNWLPKMLESRGFSPETAGFTASIPLLAAIPSVLLIPFLTPKHLRGRVLAVLSFLASAGLLLSYFSSSWLLQGGLVLYGIAAPVLLPMLVLVLMDDPNVGPEHMGLAGGIFFGAAEIGGFTGPLLMGVLVDITGGFLLGISFLAGMGIISAVLALLLRKL